MEYQWMVIKIDHSAEAWECPIDIYSHETEDEAKDNYNNLVKKLNTDIFTIILTKKLEEI